MSTTVQIPGGTATLRDPAQLKERHRRLIQTANAPLAKIFRKLPAELVRQAQGKGPAARAAQAKAERLMGEAIETRQEAAAVVELRDAVIVALLEDWSLDQPLPTMDTVQDLDGDLYDALNKATRHLSAAVTEASAPTDFGPDDPSRDSPFGESVSSSNGSKGGRKRPTRILSVAGADTSTADTSDPE